MNRSERIVGAGLGQALGDALGFHVERQSGATASAFVERVLRGEAVEPIRTPYAIGQVSDDTQLSLCLMHALIAENGRFDAEALKRAMLAMRDVVGGGTGTLEAIARMRAGTPAAEGGRLNRTPSNGAAMRIWPLAAARRLENCDACCDLTHGAAEARSCAKAFAHAVAYVLDGGGPDAAPAAIRGIDAALDEALSLLAQSDEPSTLWRFAKTGELPQWRNVPPRALPTVAWAIHAARISAKGMAAVYRKAVVCGGDVDTTASLADTLAGAHHGVEAMNAMPIARLHDGWRWRAEDLRATLAAFAKVVEGRSQ